MAAQTPDDFDVNPYSSPDEESGAPPERSESDMEEIRNEHLTHEGMVQGVGVFFLISGAFSIVMAIICGVALYKGDLPEAINPRPAANAPIVFTEEVARVLLIIYGVGAPISLILGQCLRMLQNWARITAGIFAIFGLLSFPVGTIVSAIILYILFSRKSAYVCSSEYREVVAATPEMRYQTPIYMKILVGLFLILMVLGLIGIGFSMLNPQLRR